MHVHVWSIWYLLLCSHNEQLCKPIVVECMLGLSGVCCKVMMHEEGGIQTVEECQEAMSCDPCDQCMGAHMLHEKVRKAKRP